MSSKLKLIIRNGTANYFYIDKFEEFTFRFIWPFSGIRL